MSLCDVDQSPLCGRTIDDWSYRSIIDDVNDDENYSTADFVQLAVALCGVFADTFRKFVALFMTFVTAAIIVYRMVRQIHGMVLGKHGICLGNRYRGKRKSTVVVLAKFVAIAVMVYALIAFYGPVVKCQLNTIIKLLNVFRSVLVGAGKRH